MTDKDSSHQGLSDLWIQLFSQQATAGLLHYTYYSCTADFTSAWAYAHNRSLANCCMSIHEPRAGTSTMGMIAMDCLSWVWSKTRLQSCTMQQNRMAFGAGRAKV